MELSCWMRRLALVLAVAGAVSSWAPPAEASARSSYLVRLLKGSSQFRVRVQAAISLGGSADEPEVVKALSQALSDDHPAVRAAAATSLGRIGNSSALGALRNAAKDGEAPVRKAVKAAIAKLGSSRSTGGAVAIQAPSGPATFYVAVGALASNAQGVDPAVLARGREFIRGKVGALDGVALAPGDESPKRVKSVLKKRKLKGFFIDSSITSVEARPGGGTRVAVSIIVATYPGRDMRAILRGAATAIGSGSSTRRQALEGALSGAMRQLPAALTRSR